MPGSLRAIHHTANGAEMHAKPPSCSKLKPKALAFTLSAFSLTACATAPIGGAPGLDVRQGDLPPPAPADLYAKADFAGVRPFDTLTIDVFGVPALSERRVETPVVERPFTEDAADDKGVVVAVVATGVGDD